MKIDTSRFIIMGGGPYADKIEADDQIRIYFHDMKNIQALRDEDTGKWYIVKRKEEKK